MDILNHPIGNAYSWGFDLLYRGNAVTLEALPDGASILVKDDILVGIEFGDSNPEDYSNPIIRHGRDGEERLRLMENGLG